MIMPRKVKFSPRGRLFWRFFFFSFVVFKVGDTTLRKLKSGQTRKRGHFTEGFASSELPHEQIKQQFTCYAGWPSFMKIKWHLKVKLEEKKKVKHAC